MGYAQRMSNSYRTGPETDRLRMRAFEVKDAEAFAQLNSDPDVIRYTGEPPVPDVATARAAIAAYPDFTEPGYGRWATIYKPESRIIGFAGLKYLDELDEVDLGYRFLPKYWGRGLATEASLACLEFGFAELELPRIIGLVLEENLASIRVLEKIGMVAAGTILYLDEPALKFEITREGWLSHVVPPRA